MKSHRLVLIPACCVIFLLSCQKESHQPQTASGNIQQQSQQDNAALQGIDGSIFGTKIDNPYFPLKPGTSFYYEHVELDDNTIILQDIQDDVLTDVKLIAGVRCRIVHDVVRQKGKLIEDTYDYYTQDTAGNVWYFGEDTRALENGQWVTTGSWLAGKDGARPGIIMWAHPEDHIGETYRQEYLKDSAEDKGKVLDANSTTTIQLGTFSNCVATEETTALEPGVKEYKYYAPGIGVILTVLNKGGAEHEELVKVVRN